MGQDTSALNPSLQYILCNCIDKWPPPSCPQVSPWSSVCVDALMRAANVTGVKRSVLFQEGVLTGDVGAPALAADAE